MSFWRPIDGAVRVAVKPAEISVPQGAASRDKTLLVMGDAVLLVAR